MIETRFGGKLLEVNLVSPQMGGILVISEEVMGRVYGRKLGKNGPVFSKVRSYPLGMVGGSISEKMFGVVRRPCVPDILLFSIWL